MSDEHTVEEHTEVTSTTDGTTEHREEKKDGEKVVDETSRDPN